MIYEQYYTEELDNGHGTNLLISIIPDTDTGNPFDAWDTFGTLKTFRSPSEFESFLEHLMQIKAAFETGNTQYEYYVIYATRETIFKEYGRKRMSRKLWKTACECLHAEHETYEMWLNGDVFGYTIMDMETGEDVESCWGFYGFDYCLEQAKEIALAYRKPLPAWVKNWGILPGLTPDMIGRPEKLYNAM